MRNFLRENGLDLVQLAALQEKPELFAAGEPLFWDNPHISQQMLRAHFDPHTDAASYRPEKIEATVGWLVEQLGLWEGTAVLDLGCGPGFEYPEAATDTVGELFFCREITKTWPFRGQK